MNQEGIEAKLLDFFEGELSTEEMDQIHLEFASDPELQKSLRIYELVLEGERLMAEETFSPSSEFVTSVMNEIDESTRSIWDCFFDWVSDQSYQIVTACALFLISLYSTESFWRSSNVTIYAKNESIKYSEPKEFPTTEILVPVKISSGMGKNEDTRFQLPLSEREIAPYIAAKVPQGFRALTITARMSGPSKVWSRSKVRFDLEVNSKIGEVVSGRIIAREVDVLFAERPILRDSNGNRDPRSQDVVATLLLRASDVPMVELAHSIGSLELSYKLPVVDDLRPNSQAINNIQS